MDQPLMYNKQFYYLKKKCFILNIIFLFFLNPQVPKSVMSSLTLLHIRKLLFQLLLLNPCQLKVKFDQIVGNKANGRISKRVFQENKARQIFRKTNISYPNNDKLCLLVALELIQDYAYILLSDFCVIDQRRIQDCYNMKGGALCDNS